MSQERQFGIQLDSLCDIVCFGVLPGVIGISIGLTEWWLVLIAVIFAICAVIRLAYFNVTEEERQSTEGGVRKTYTGLVTFSITEILITSIHATEIRKEGSRLFFR